MKLLRRIAFPLLICLGVLYALNAYADEVYDWNHSCRMKTKGATTVYSRLDYSQEIGSIPANTYVKIASTDVNGWSVFSYMTSNGIKGSGVARRSNFVPAVVDHYDEDGILTDTHELLWQGGNSSNDSNRQSSTAPSTANEQKNKNTFSSTEKQNTDLKATQAIKTENGTPVQLVQLGTTSSIIIVAGEEQTVPTKELTLSDSIDADKAIAVIYAPNTGKCSLRPEASESAKAIKQCKAGTVVGVLEYGKKFCKVNYHGSIGYVLTRCLNFCNSSQESLGTGVLTYNGKATGKTTINIRNSADGDSAKITEWKTGTEVLVFALTNGWYEIEHNGIHGFVMEKFLTMND